MTTTPATQALLPVTTIDALWSEMSTRANRETDDEADDAHAVGFRDGFEIAVQKLDELTGGDGEYRFSTDPERNCPTPVEMIANIVERFQSHSLPGDVGTDLVKRAEAIINANSEYMEGFDRGRRHFGRDAVLRMVIAALTPSALSDLQRLGQEYDESFPTEEEWAAQSESERYQFLKRLYARSSALSGDAGEKWSSIADELRACDGWGGLKMGKPENVVISSDLRERILAALPSHQGAGEP